MKIVPSFVASKVGLLCLLTNPSIAQQQQRLRVSRAMYIPTSLLVNNIDVDEDGEDGDNNNAIKLPEATAGAERATKEVPDIGILVGGDAEIADSAVVNNVAEIIRVRVRDKRNSNDSSSNDSSSNDNKSTTTTTTAATTTTGSCTPPNRDYPCTSSTECCGHPKYYCRGYCTIDCSYNY